MWEVVGDSGGVTQGSSGAGGGSGGGGSAGMGAEGTSLTAKTCLASSVGSRSIWRRSPKMDGFKNGRPENPMILGDDGVH